MKDSMKQIEYPYKSLFASINVKPIVSADKDKYLALASLEEIRAFLPNVDSSVNTDLLPVAFNACVVNRVNKNDDVIDSATAVAMYKNFINKQINIEHNRKNVIGVILAAGFSEFGTDKPMTEEEAKASVAPYNITLGGVIWKVVNEDLADLIEDSNDPTSLNYMSIAASWELGFTDYQVVVLDPAQKNIEAGTIISEESELNKLQNKLKAKGGDGKTIDDKRVYRMPIGKVVPMGIGFTQKPAADVEGIAVPSELVNKSTSASEVNNINQKNISQASNSDVNRERKEPMKITSLKDINDENIKQLTITAASISEFISQELSSKDGEWQSKKEAVETQLKAAKENQEKLSKESKDLADTVKTLQASVDTLTKEKAEREKVDQFNVRMSSVNDLYELDDEIRATIVEEVKSIASDEDFTKWQKKASILLKGYAKKKDPVAKEPPFEKDKPADPKADDEAKKAKAALEAKASLENALDNGKEAKGGLPNSSSGNVKTLKEKYSGVFALDQFEIKK